MRGAPGEGRGCGAELRLALLLQELRCRRLLSLLLRLLLRSLLLLYTLVSATMPVAVMVLGVMLARAVIGLTL